MKDSNHVVRVFGLVALLLIGGGFAQRALRPKTFGETGHYRFESLSEVLSQEVVHQGQQACGECHEDIYDLHDKDIHYNVECEDCHGPGNRHIHYYTDDETTLTEEEARMPTEYTLEGCLFCHRKLDARPNSFPEIDPVEHYAFLHVTDQKTKCIECHNPHEPIYLLAKVEEARIHPIIYQCDDCHETQPTEDYKEVEGHPVIFTCGDCHPAVVEDFKEHEHSFMSCTACHLFHVENETAGRIFKNGNGKFCLLCHEEKPFKDPEGVPQIVSKEHLAEMAEILDKTESEVQKDPRSCLECHFEYIHDPELISKGVTVGGL
ncbi:MAG: hypothetical protein KC994_05820 [Candidatus Omnitrophica bacterium]|nr:hypothetical protein [Candidatus Omnitrophota bacterium]